MFRKDPENIDMNAIIHELPDDVTLRVSSQMVSALVSQLKLVKEQIKEEKNGADYPESDLTNEIIAAAIEVHSTLGCAFNEPVYQVALAHEFALRAIFKGRRVSKYNTKELSLGSIAWTSL